jgi:spore coat protein CotF
MEKKPVVSTPKSSDPQVRKTDEDSLKFPLALAKAVHDIVTGKILEPSPNGALRPLE